MKRQLDKEESSTGAVVAGEGGGHLAKKKRVAGLAAKPSKAEEGKDFKKEGLTLQENSPPAAVSPEKAGQRAGGSKAQKSALQNPHLAGKRALDMLSDSELAFLGLGRESTEKLPDCKIAKLIVKRRLEVVREELVRAPESMQVTLKMMRRAGTPLAVVTRVLWQMKQVGGCAVQGPGWQW